MNWDAVQKFVTVVGLPTAFAVVLLWFVISRVDKAIEGAVKVQQEIKECACRK